MMPRQHDNTIKYEVDNNMQKIKKLKSVKPKNNKTPIKTNENNSSNLNTNINNINIANNQMNIFSNLPPLFDNNNFNIPNKNDNNNNMFNPVNNNQILKNNLPNQISANINQNDIIPNNIDVNSILIMSGVKKSSNNSNNNNLYQPKNLNHMFDNCNNSLSQSQYPCLENKENCQNNYINSNNQQGPDSKFSSSKKNEKLETKDINKNFIQKNSGSMGFAFLNDYTSFTNKVVNNKNNKNNSNEKKNLELIELKEKYEKIVNDILFEEKNCLETHKSHIDDMVLTMKNEMNLINTLEQKSNVDEYVDEILNIFGEQENKITLMKKKLLCFKRLLKEENELSQKISALNENYSNNDSNQKYENNINEDNKDKQKYISLDETKE